MTRTTKYLTFAAVCLVMIPFVPNKEPLDASQQIAPKDTVYYLIGPQQNFQLLFQAVNYPRDVTDNQRASITQWIAGAKMLEQVPDSLKDKPTVVPKKGKP